jgi:transcriptional regulator with XRE-family HTH domain
MTNHWTQKSTEDFAYSLSMDFFTQLEDKLNDSPMIRKDFAEKLGITPGAVSQMFNTPPTNPKVESLVRYASAVGLKISIVAYDDHDANNDKGPVFSGVFSTCWEKMGCPRDLSMFEQPANVMEFQHKFVDVSDQKLSVTSQSSAASARIRKANCA